MNIEQSLNEWHVVAHSDTTRNGYTWGWIENSPDTTRWSNEPGSSLTHAQAVELVKKHNEWLAKQTPASVRLFKAKERMSALSLESAIASAKASKLQEQLREAEAEVMALERAVERERATLIGDGVSEKIT